jgi:aryl-alcohol dehydrogenase-like predicted oxidoreductase
MEMEYRRLGRSGLQVSVLSFGSWVTFGPQLAGSLAEECLSAAYEAGVNFFDNAEAYSAGESERIMGEAIAGPGTPTSSRPSSSGASTRRSTCATPSTAST